MALDIRTGERYGRLVVGREVAVEATEYNRHRYWMCRCDCGNEKLVAGYRMKQGRTRSCGCLHREVAASNIRRVHERRGYRREGK